MKLGILLMAAALGGCASATVTHLGGGKYRAVAYGNAFQNHQDTLEDAEEKAKEICEESGGIVTTTDTQNRTLAYKTPDNYVCDTQTTSTGFGSTVYSNGTANCRNTGGKIFYKPVTELEFYCD